MSQVAVGRCDETGLLVTECAARCCRPDLTRVGVAEDLEISYRFTTAFNWTCAGCDERMEAGTKAARDVNRDLYCADCAR